MRGPGLDAPGFISSWFRANTMMQASPGMVRQANAVQTRPGAIGQSPLGMHPEVAYL